MAEKIQNNMKVSIITVVYNNESTIESCIKSVINQIYPHIEYIIIDGKSTDKTLEIINNYSKNISIIKSEPDNGIYDAMNKGLECATGDIISFLNADDIYVNNEVIGKIVNMFTNYNIDSCYADLIYVDKYDLNKIIRFWKSTDYSYSKLFYGWMPPHPTFFVKRRIYKQYGGFQIKYKIASDYDIMLRFLGKYKISTKYLNEVIIKMRYGGISNKSIKNLIRKSKEDYLIQRENGFGNIFALLFKNISKVPQFFKKKI